MNKTFLKLSAFLMLICSLTVFAQGVKSQSEMIREKLLNGKYKKYLSSRNIEFSEILPDKNQPNDHFELVVKLKPDHATESERNKTTQFFPDNIAFPVTYNRSAYKGNKKLQEKFGYSVRHHKYADGKERLIFVDDYLFFVEYWKNKDHYTLVSVFKRGGDKKVKKSKKKKKKKKGFGSFFKALKEEMIAGSSGGSSNNDAALQKIKAEVLQPYLDKAFAKQNTYYAKWVKKPENKKMDKYIKDLHDILDKAEDQYNEDLYNSPEYRRIRAHRAALKGRSVTVYNESGRTLWVGHSSPSFTSHQVANGMSYELQHCDDPVYYYYGEGTGQTGHKVAEGNTKCGGSVTIN